MIKEAKKRIFRVKINCLWNKFIRIASNSKNRKLQQQEKQMDYWKLAF